MSHLTVLVISQYQQYTSHPVNNIKCRSVNSTVCGNQVINSMAGQIANF